MSVYVFKAPRGYPKHWGLMKPLKALGGFLKILKSLGHMQSPLGLCKTSLSSICRKKICDFRMCVHTNMLFFQFYHHLLIALVISPVSALTHIMQICRNFDIANSPQYCDNNTLPHIAHFHGKIQETVQK